jgi:membrane protein
MRWSWQEAFAVADETTRRALEHELGTLAGNLAYRFFIALVPFLVLLVAVSGFVAHALQIADPAHQIVGALGASLPSDVAKVLQGQLEQTFAARNAALVSAGVVGTLVAATSAFMALFVACNRTYGVAETRSLVQRCGIALALTISAGTLVVVAFTLVVAGEAISGRLVDALGARGGWGVVVGVAKGLLEALLVLLAVMALYRIAPNRRTRRSGMLPGALLFVLVWVVATQIFALYLSHSRAFGPTYGALAGAVILLIWFYVTSLIVLVGAELNAVIEQRLNPTQVAVERLQAQAAAQQPNANPATRPAAELARAQRRS